MFAKQQGGTFLLRIEDTDQERLVVGADERLFAVLKRMGLKPDNKKIAYQSKRLKLYKEHAEQLLEQGSAYECFCTKERLDTMRQEQTASHRTPKYDRHCLKMNADEIKRLKDEKTSSVIRLKVPEGATTFEDIIRGRVTIQNADVDDQVLFKSDGFPTYHLANVVDDHEMHVTHVIRGEEWLPSTPKHVMLYTAFGWTPPAFAHLPLLLNPDKSKLSKRQGDVAVEDFLSQGYLPEALMNFVALLGFNPTADREIFTMEELIRLFDLEKNDLLGAIEYLEKEKNITKIGLYGFSLGGAVALMVNHENVKAIVTDSAYAKLSNIVKHMYRIFFILKYPLAYLTKLYGILFLRINIDDASPVESIKNLEIPILLIHAEKDSQIPVKEAYLLHNANKKAELWIVKNAEHGMTHSVDTGKYEKRVIGFFEQSIK